ncbi:DUF4041 domain-containing protein [Aeromonas australiensis]|uniref:DUF4041 domain-containing protein n=1 Tax=Aeromonas australiensis TaxID=1114880 RepID=UPI0006947A06|nr:DUF4041 domain-containing protein [Aeromonas australiensis]
MLIISVIIFSLAVIFSFYCYKDLKKLKPTYDELELKFSPIEKEKTKLSAIEAKYRLLQQDYQRGINTLQLQEDLISQYDIGIGTVDPVMYKSSSGSSCIDILNTRLTNVQNDAKKLVKDKQACICTLGDNLTVNNSKAKARTLINREIKLRLRCFDNEVDAAISLADWNNINRLISRVRRSFDEINNCGKIIKTQIQTPYLLLKIEELMLSYEVEKLTADIKESEREETRLRNEAEREEAKIKSAAEKAQKNRELMEKLIQNELSKLDSATEEQRELLAMHQQELEILKQREKRAVSMAQLTRAGYVYVISNEMSFGPDVVKIGMTRRVDPYDRIRELGDASVPDTFDVHAMFYCDDAPALESSLHQKFAHARLNLVNNRKEFFRVSPDEVITAVEHNGIEVLRAA